MANQPNPAAQERQRLFRTLHRQAALIREQGIAIAALAVQTGQDSHQMIASVVKRAADEVAMTDEQAASPDAKDSVDSVGAAPSSANTSVTPDATTTVTETGTVPASTPQQVDLESTVGDVDSAPSPADAKVPITIKSPAGTTNTFDNGTFGSKGEPQQRIMACLALARLRRQAEIEDGDELVMAQAISDSDETLASIQARTSTLTEVMGAKTAQVATPRNLVPQRTAGRRQPSLSGGQESHQVTASNAITDEELGFMS